MSAYQLELETGAVKGTVTFDFTPTLENAPSLLMDIAALIEAQAKATDEKMLADIRRLEDKVAILEKEKSFLVAALKDASAKKEEKEKVLDEVKETVITATAHSTRGTAKIGERVRIAPHDEYKYWHQGVVQGYKDRTRSVLVRPDKHDHDIWLDKKYVKRIKREV